VKRLLKRSLFALLLLCVPLSCGGHEFNPKNYVANPDESCAWACLEMALLHAGHADARGLARRKFAEHERGTIVSQGASFADLKWYLDRAEVRFAACLSAGSPDVSELEKYVVRRRLPAVVGLQLGPARYHAVLVLAITTDKVEIVDPNSGIETQTRAWFATRWDGRFLAITEKKK